MYGPAKPLAPAAEYQTLELVRTKYWRTAKRDSVALLLSSRAGLRISEIAQLTWADVSDAAGAFSDEVRVRRETTKGKTFTRFIPMNKELRTELMSEWAAFLRR